MVINKTEFIELLILLLNVDTVLNIKPILKMACQNSTSIKNTIRKYVCIEFVFIFFDICCTWLYHIKTVFFI